MLGSGGSLRVERLALPFIDVTSDRAFFLLLAAVFALGRSGRAASCRRRPFGRRLAALNDSPAACATMGVSVTATKLIVFMSAAMAGLGGALLGGLHGSVSPNDFLLLNSLVLLLLATIGGLYTVSGAL